jgi:hypothetical protein
MSEVTLRENLPVMVLSDETTERVTFRVRNVLWSVMTGASGIGLVSIAVLLYLSGNLTSSYTNWSSIVVGVLGALLIYSSIFSITTTQWLTADGKRKTIKFFKRNLYGHIYWERSSQDFQGIKIWRYMSRNNDWQIILMCNDGVDLYIGENLRGASTKERALDIANKISRKIEVKIETND